MSKIRKPTKADISAMLSNDVVLRKIRNQTVVSTPTIPRESTSEKKKKATNRFAEASHWAKEILTDPAIKELYSKRISSSLPSAHTVAVKDYLTRPVIHYISLKQHTGAIGDKISIKATDDFQVTAMTVTITDKNGKQVETGPAVRNKRKPAMWNYMLSVANPDTIGTVISVIAMDRPENRVVKEVTVGGRGRISSISQLAL